MIKTGNKFIDFIRFMLSYKLPKILKKKSDEELLDLYHSYSPYHFKPMNNATYMEEHLYFKVFGHIVVYIVGTEFKRRYPESVALKEWDFTKEIDLHEIIRQLRANGIK